ncbi:uncharacterized protein LOC5513961 [Nematostella vectensis]|uniref:uncharacterized protein LOC5513961 n=1 Tax=Nematostella vectensis TaxID=45351 RepID=UPI002076D914|nr:uncharacterized protein LOC5513961 [Nematostella vectensis]
MASNCLVGLVTMLVCAQCIGALTVRDYGSFQVSMLRHGEIYATDRACYAWEDVTPWYHGMTHIRGPNDKQGDIRMRVDRPVKIFLAIDSRYPQNGPPNDQYKRTPDSVVLGGCHARTLFYIYESIVTHGPGHVIINAFSDNMAGIFLRDARLISPAARLHVTSLPAGWELGMMRDGEKYATNRASYAMTDVAPKFYGTLHLRGPNDKTSPMTFNINVPATLYVAIDTRYPNPLDMSFVATGEKLVLAGSHPRTDFAVYEKSLPPGNVVISLSATRMLAVMLKPQIDNTFKAGVY